MAVTRARRYTVGEMRLEQVEKLTRPLTLVVCLAALIVSYAQIKWAAGIIGLPPAMTWLFPLLIDVPALVASGLTVALHGSALRLRVYAWSVLLIFLSLSWFCNGLHAVASADIGRLPVSLQDSGLIVIWLLAAIPPIGAVLGPHLYSTVLRTGVRAQELSDVRTTETRTPVQPARPAAPVRATTAAPARTLVQPAARTDAPMSAPTSTLTRTIEVAGVSVRRQNGEAAVAVRALYEQATVATPGVKPAANRLADLAGISDEQINAAQVRKWVAAWWAADTGTVDTDLTLTVDTADSSDTRAA